MHRQYTKLDRRDCYWISFLFVLVFVHSVQVTQKYFLTFFFKRRPTVPERSMKSTQSCWVWAVLPRLPSSNSTKSYSLARERKREWLTFIASPLCLSRVWNPSHPRRVRSLHHVVRAQWKSISSIAPLFKTVLLLQKGIRPALTFRLAPIENQWFLDKVLSKSVQTFCRNLNNK